MGMLAELVDYVVGVDTHRDGHSLALVEATTGAVVAQRTVPSNGRGYAEALRFARQPGGGPSLGGRGRRPLRRRACPLSEPPRRDRARGRPLAAELATAAR
jgi:hypothetical protein